MKYIYCFQGAAINQIYYLLQQGLVPMDLLRPRKQFHLAPQWQKHPGYMALLCCTQVRRALERNSSVRTSCLASQSHQIRTGMNLLMFPSFSGTRVSRIEIPQSAIESLLLVIVAIVLDTVTVATNTNGCLFCSTVDQ